MDELMELCQEDLTAIMVNKVLEDDPNDLDWMPEKLKIRLQSKRRRQRVRFRELKLSNTPEFYAGEQPKQYAKGPDVMRKSK